MKTTMPTPVESKSIKHTFTLEERDNLGGDLARAIATLRNIQSEFDQIKASFKSRAAEAEARISKLQTDRVNGFEMRLARCYAVLRPKDGKKDWYLEHAAEGDSPVLTEDMTKEDFQTTLPMKVDTVAAPDKRSDVVLFSPTPDDFGNIEVRRNRDGLWLAGITMIIGPHKLMEDASAGGVFVNRFDAIKLASRRAIDWLTATLGKESAQGFIDSITSAVNAEIGKVE